jgi:hypothetical protein
VVSYNELATNSDVIVSFRTNHNYLPNVFKIFVRLKFKSCPELKEFGTTMIGNSIDRYGLRYEFNRWRLISLRYESAIEDLLL